MIGKQNVGSRIIARLSPRERILRGSVPEPNTGCWLWFGVWSHNGYGRVSFGHELFPAHRVSYQAFRGPVPPGMIIDHLCRVRCCVNPDHLEVVTPRQNVMRGKSFIVANTAKTHCPRGHEYTPENTYMGDHRDRQCRKCRRIHDRSSKARERVRRGLLRDLNGRSA